MPDVALSWTDNSNNEDGFYVYRSTTANPSFPADYTQIDSVGSNTTSYTDTGVGTGEFSYAVTAYNGAGESSETTDSVITPIGEARIDKSGTTLSVAIYDPATITDNWLRVRVGNTVGVFRPIDKTGEVLRARSPSDTIVGVETKQL